MGTKERLEILKEKLNEKGIYPIHIDSEAVINELLKRISNLEYEVERLNKKIEQYENPEDMTLMFMWCDEKAKDEIKRLNNIIDELEKWLKYQWYEIGEDLGLNEVLNKIEELKGSDKE